MTDENLDSEERSRLYWRNKARIVSYIPVPQAAVVYELLWGQSVSTGTLYRLIRNGRLGAVRPGGGELLIRPCDIGPAREARRADRRMLREGRLILEGKIRLREHGSTGREGPPMG